MKYMLLMVLLCIARAGTAQNTDITGSYSLSQGAQQPEGGATLLVFKDHNFVIAYFGGMQKGTWQIIKDTLVEFKRTDMPSGRFALYGRHNKDLGDSTRIFFQGFDNPSAFIHFGKPGTSKLLMRRVFNADANCISFPDVYKTKTAADYISFTKAAYYDAGDDREQQDIYTYDNREKYNDLIAVSNKESHDDDAPAAFYALLQKEGLYFTPTGKTIARKPLPGKENKEDAKFISWLIAYNPEPDTVYFNPFYNQASREHLDEWKGNYVYQEQKGAYIDTLNYTEGAEYNEDDFNNLSVIYPFKRLTHFTTTRQAFNIDEQPVFYFTCNDEQSSSIDTAATWIDTAASTMPVRTGATSFDKTKLSQTDQKRLREFWKDLKAALNPDSKTKLAARIQFPFPCDDCILDSAQVQSYPYLVISRGQYDKDQYKIFFGEDLRKVAGTKDILDILYTRIMEGESAGMPELGYMADGKHFFTLEQVGGRFLITAVRAVP